MTDFAETAEISGKFTAYYANMINYVHRKTNSEKSANFWRREEL